MMTCENVQFILCTSSGNHGTLQVANNLRMSLKMHYQADYEHL